MVISGDRVYDYTKTEKIPLLEDLLKMMKDSGLLMILEMKPSDPSFSLSHSRETGVEVAKMVKRLGLEKQVVLSSFDPFKLYHARKEFDRLNTCFLVTKGYWDDISFLSTSKANLAHLEGLKDCLGNVSDTNYGKFILESPAVVKAIGASSLDMDYDIYNNPTYSNDTYEMFKKKYGPEFSYGAWTIYKMKFNAKQLDDSEEKLQNLIDNKADRLYADDIPRLLKMLGRPVRKNAASLPDYFTVSRIVITLLLVCSLIK
jgi:glycerophosphoryl diester phosphodiesterase